MKVNIGKGITLDVDVARLNGGAMLNNSVMEHVVGIGLRNILMDCHAGITKVDNPDNYAALSLAKAEEKLAAMYNGDIRVARRSSGTTRDPIRILALAMARKIVNSVFAWSKAKGEWVIRDAEQWAAVRAAYGEDYDFTDTTEDGAIADVHSLLCEAQADECMVEAEAEYERRGAVKAKPIGLAGLVKKA